MIVLLAAFVTAFLIAFIAIPLVIKYSIQNNLVDVPGRRKIHKQVTPSMGGIAIFSGLFISTLIWVNVNNWNEIKFVIAALTIVFITGLRDDLIPLRPLVKLGGQVLAATILVVVYDMRLHSFYGLISGEWPLWISYLVSVFTMIIITNSFNLIDGLDGLAGLISISSLIAFGSWFFVMNDQVYAVIVFATVGAIFAFLRFNWEPAKIFMGDTGSLVLGLLLSICVIHFINLNDSMAEDAPMHFEASIATAGCFIIIPLIDTFRIIILRVLKGQSPLKPDKQHIHHAVMRLGLSHSKTSLVLAGVQVFFIFMAIMVMKVGGDRILLPALFLLATLFSVVLDRKLIKKVS